jgi:hypothetical protein
MLERIPDVFHRHRQGELSDASTAALYFLYWQVHRHGEGFAARRNRLDPRPCAGRWLSETEAVGGIELDRRLAGWFETYQFRGIIPAVPTALAAWLRGLWPLRLMFRIPSPREVLTMQVEGSRPVTLVADPARMLRPVLSKADGFAFLVHDLEHAHKFYADPELHAGQRRLFARLQAGLDAGLFQPFADDSRFAAKLDYLISDMNTHIVHGLLYLRAILVESGLRREGKAPNEELSRPVWEEISYIIKRLAPEVELPAPR